VSLRIDRVTGTVSVNVPTRKSSAKKTKPMLVSLYHCTFVGSPFNLLLRICILTKLPSQIV
jgi:hypothetical protein